MQKTLIIDKQYPFPETTGGKMRTANFVRYFAEKGSVDVVYSQPLEDLKPPKWIVQNGYYIERTKYPDAPIGRAVQLLKGRPYPVFVFSSKSERELFSIINAKEYDYILVRYIVNAYSLLKLPRHKKHKIILDFDDMISESLYETFFNPTKSYYKKTIRALNRLVLKRYEKKCSGLGTSLFTSSIDKERSDNYCRASFVVPNIYLNESFNDYDFKQGFENQNIFLFVGTLSYNPNVEGLKWFVESIYPKAKNEIPNLKLLVVGHLGDATIDDFRKKCKLGEEIELHANVEDIKEYYERCRFVLVPLLQGGGTRIKILEAALASRPVLSTRIGAEGLDLQNGRDLLLFSNYSEFIQSYKKLDSEEEYVKIVSNAYRNVKDNYSLQKFNSAMDNAIARIY
jgi:glycosyltransferase involved in cell wall biosynthesis